VDSAIFSGTVNSRLFLDYEFDDFHYKSQSEEVVEQVEAYLEANAEKFMVGTVYSFYTENRAGTVISLSREDLSDDEMKELRTAIRDDLPEIPGARILFEQEADEGGSATYFAVKLFGQDSTTLYRLADEAARRLETMDGVEDVSRPRSTGRREIQVSLDRARAAELGRTAAASTPATARSSPGLPCVWRTDRASRTCAKSLSPIRAAGRCCSATLPASSSSRGHVKSSAKTARSRWRCAAPTTARTGTTP
jgi:multidrug efflux pump subunit AcrB